MNALMIFVLIILVFSSINGLRKGVIGIVYGVVSWIFIFVFVIFATPYLNTYLHENTKVYQTISEKTQEYLNRELERFLSVDAQQAQNAANLDSMDLAQIPQETLREIQNALNVVLESLPEGMAQEIEVHGLTSGANFYSGMVNGITEMVMKGVATALTFLVALIIAGIVGVILTSVSELPGVQGVNVFFGLVVGAFQGLLYVWILMYIAIVFSPTSFGQTMLAMIQESPFLTYLYQHNLVLTILQCF